MKSDPHMKESLKQVSSLVERFERNIGAYRSPAYNETQLRIEFIDPFFEEIYNLLSKDSIQKGFFDKFIESEKLKRGATEVDAEFLKEIESWREALAKDIALGNPKLSVKELNFAVQLTIDRIIFLRMCEDRGIEKYGQIQSLLNGANVYHRLRELFYNADGKYNSGLFDFGADRLTPELRIDDKPQGRVRRMRLTSRILCLYSYNCDRNYRSNW